MLVRILSWMAIGLGVMQALFFLGAAILPLQTVGPPAFDRPLIREQMWGGSGQPMLFGLTALALILSGVLGPGPKRLGGHVIALGLLLGAHVVLVSETSMLIRHGELSVSHDTGNTVMLVTRIGSAALAVLAAIQITRIAFAQLLREA